MAYGFISSSVVRGLERCYSRRRGDPYPLGSDREVAAGHQHFVTQSIVEQYLETFGSAGRNWPVLSRRRVSPWPAARVHAHSQIPKCKSWSESADKAVAESP